MICLKCCGESLGTVIDVATRASSSSDEIGANRHIRTPKLKSVCESG